MFTPEFIDLSKNEYVLLANHNLENQDAINLSVQYNKARIAFGAKHLPPHMKSCRIIYDIRGQSISDLAINEIILALAALCTVEFKR
ncbi:hypothetical protein H8L32_18110 [Undibacterium sp. CY18W]|uniref:Uncharacterized protein n=1 Tax=Undibacterium hunanense TaxID=2762292 RepID=A0ABR6ZU39_9BURK|nr:hypothetical protein [Undibacterium hunanense]MBC3919411.1 hypothetical protein [Undibacterium hunanense]